MSYVECKIPGCGNPVFATQLCRKHYERERLATASPCSISGCQARSFRGGMCEQHYRADIMSRRPVCSVPNCGNPQKNLTLKLCQKHEFRIRNHGSLEQQRPDDWGSRESHPLYSIWTYHRRLLPGLCDSWRNDFWLFVRDVGEKPEGFTLRRIIKALPLGPDNWTWKQSVSNSDPAKYQRIWRKNNPERAKHHNLKRFYGITLDQYNEMGERQGWRCAICGGWETTKDRDGGPRKMPVDHDHNTGKVRDLLCTQCNRGLGLFKENIENLESAITYLKKHQQTKEA